jgi:hypothetical protein
MPFKHVEKVDIMWKKYEVYKVEKKKRGGGVYYEV